MALPKLLDLFACQGGAGYGYALAGFDVHGIDIDPQPRYPNLFTQADAVAYAVEHVAAYDAVHASPPCQRWTDGAKQAGTHENHPDLIEPIREILAASGKPYIIENIPRAPLLDPVMLCGTMFGLGVVWQGRQREVRRHRLFESNVELSAPRPCSHTHQTVTITGNAGGYSARDRIHFPSTDAWRTAMGMPWATGRGCAEAVPPAYTQHLGGQLIEALR